MIVAREQFREVVEKLLKLPKLSFDSETSGLKVWHTDRLFSAIFSDGTDAFYFNFQDYPDDPKFDRRFLLPRAWIKMFWGIFDDSQKIVFMHNAKFDMGMLHQEGVTIRSIVHCTQANARVEYNDHMEYDLNSCLTRIGDKKDDAVSKYIDENRLWKWELVPGKKSRKKLKFFQLVPFDIIVPYAEQDALGTFKLGEHQISEIEKISDQNNTAIRPLSGIMHMERRLTKTCFGMEKTGVKIDVGYCKEAIEYETGKYETAAREFERLTGIEFVDSGKTLAEAFTKMGEEYPTTAKGNPSFTDEVLQGFQSPVAKIVQEYRDAYKRCNTYFRSFLYYSDKDGIIHPNMWQGGTKTGRFSYSDPNFQNLTKDEDLSHPFPIRRAIIPPEGYLLGSIDYDQQEFRMMLDYAGQLDLIEKIIAGFDPHQSTAELVGVSRRPAKILNFGLLYGMGKDKLARQIGCTVGEAIEFKQKYFSSLPEVKKFIRGATETAEKRGFVFTWAGRRLHFPDAQFAYRAANGIIQGGCADVTKVSMNQIDDFLAPHKTRMAIQVHDELLFVVPFDEWGIMGDLKKIMESVYPYRHIPLTCSISHGVKSWGDMIEGEPNEAGNSFQNTQSSPFPKGAAQYLVL